MKLSEAYKIVKGAVKAQIPVMLWGPPGIGKSSIIHQIASENNQAVVDLRLAQLEPTDLRGVPMPNRDTGRAEWYLPAFWPASAKTDTTRDVLKEDGTTEKVAVKAGDCVDGPGIIFLDEIEKAPISVKNASLQLVLDRMVGSYKLPNDWAIVCAGNREEDGCFSQPLGAALSNRMIHLEVEPDVEAWAAWARDGDRVVDDIIGFLHFKPELLYKQTEEHAFPTPRSWVIGSNMIKSVKSNRDQKDLLAAAVGRGAAQEYTVWANVYKSVDPEAVLNGQLPDFSKADQSFKYAVTLAVAFHLKKRKGGIKKVEANTAKFLEILSPELRVVALKQLHLQVLEQMAKAPEFKAITKDIMKIAV